MEEYRQVQWWSTKLSLSFWPDLVMPRMLLATMWPLTFSFSLLALCRIITRKEELNIDVLAIVLEPEQACRWIQKEIEALIETTAEQAMSVVGSDSSCNSDGATETSLDSLDQQQIPRDQIGIVKYPIKPGYLETLSLSSSQTKFSFVPFSGARQLVEILERIKQEHLVRPVLFHEKLPSNVTLSAFSTICVHLLGLFSFFAALFAFITIKSYFTPDGQNRLDIFLNNIDQIRSGSGFNNSKTMCLQLENMRIGHMNTIAECEAFSKNNEAIHTKTSYQLDANLLRYLILEFPVDALRKLLPFGWKHLFLIIELVFVASVPASVAALWLNFCLISSLIQLQWIWQIRNQMNLCSRLAEKIYHRRLTLFQSIAQRQINAGGGTDMKDTERELQRDEEKLIECLTICYINFMLFRRRHGRVRKLLDFLISQIAIFASSSYASVYLSTDFHSCTLGYIMFGTGFVLALLNAYLVTGCVICKAFELLVKEHHYMAAYLARCSLEPKGKLIRGLWARQLLVRKEIENFIAPKFLHISLSVDKFISINSYVLLFWFITIRLNLQGNLD